MAVVEINFVKADKITNEINNTVEEMVSINSSAKGISADIFASYSSRTIELNDAMKTSISNAATNCDTLLSRFSYSIKLYKDAYEESKKVVEGKIKEPTGKQTIEENPKTSDNPQIQSDLQIAEEKEVQFNIDELKYNEIVETTKFYYNYPGNVKEVSKLSSTQVGNLLVKNGATKNGSIYNVNINGTKYGYNVDTGEISINGQNKRFYCNFFARNDATYEDITNTITILAGQGALDGKAGPTKKGNSLYEGVKTNKSSLVVVPYGTGYGHTTVFIHEGISAATRLGNFMVGGANRKITNSIVGYSLGGMAAYRTVAQNKGLYNKIVAVNSFMQADMDKNGGDWSAFNNCEIIMLEAAGDKFVDGAIGTLKRLKRNGISLDNVHVYTNDRTMINYSKKYLSDNNINDWGVHNSELKGWRTHNYGIEMIKSSGILNYLS